jgi:hypothetical protein
MRHANLFLWIIAFTSATITAQAQELPIAVGSDNTMCGGGAFDGTNYLFTILGDAQNQNNITAQVVSSSGSLVGSRISLGHTGSSPVAAFDGARYLVAWTDTFPPFAGGDTSGIGNIYGQFVSTAGNLVGSTFTIVTDANIRFGKGRGGLTFQDTTFFLTYLKGGNHTDYLYGQRISRSGVSVGAPVQISSSFARECALAFDGTNYLMAWCKVAYPGVDKDIYGQFVSKSGALVGSNFLIDGSQNASDNPVSMTFDGSRYWVGFHDQAADTNNRWNLIGRFVSTSGAIAERFTVCDSASYPTYAVAAFDGSNYLITWLETGWPVRVKGRFFSPTGTPIAAAFTVFDTLGGKFPIGGVGGYINGRFLLSATRFGANYSDGDIYLKFLQSSTTGVKRDELNHSPDDFVLSQNYPNPFNPSTTIGYGLPRSSYVTLSVYNTLGQQIAVLFRGNQEAGYHEVRFDGPGLASGVYFYRLEAGGFVQTKSLLLLR